MEGILSQDELKEKTLEHFVITQNPLSFDTMIKTNDKNCEDRWTPKAVSDLSKKLNLSYKVNWEKKIKDNIIYNLQYLEYLQKQLDELILRDSIRKMINKNYVVIGMSVVEGLFTYYLKKTGQYNYSEWKSFKKDKLENAKEEIIDGKKVKKSIEYFEKTDKFEVSMSLDSMIKKICNGKLINFNNADLFKDLNVKRQLRNEIHLYLDSIYKTDYKTFDDSQQKAMKKTLYTILTNSEFFFGDDREKDIIYDFLKE